MESYKGINVGCMCKKEQRNGGMTVKSEEKANHVIINTLMEVIDCSQEEAEILTSNIVENLENSDFYLRHEPKNEEARLQMRPIFDEKNPCQLTSEEVLSFIEKEGKVTVILGTAFDQASDTEDVFRGLMGDEGFESDDDIQNALISRTSVKHTFFIQNAKKETPFNEIGMVKRLIRDGFWTSIILHDHPVKNGLYAMILKAE